MPLGWAKQNEVDVRVMPSAFLVLHRVRTQHSDSPKRYSKKVPFWNPGAAPWPDTEPAGALAYRNIKATCANLIILLKTMLVEEHSRGGKGQRSACFHFTADKKFKMKHAAVDS